jgi:hypothetical protein
MAKTLLNAVNETLKRVNQIAGDAGLLASLTDSARQHMIDIAVQVTNEGNIDLYAVSDMAMPNEQAESFITLATGDRDYALAADLVMLRWPLIDKTNNQYLTQFPGGYNRMLVHDPEQDDTGLPQYAAIRPTDAQLFLDRAPTSVENGRIYTYQYDKSLLLTAAANTVPFTDEVFAMMVPVWTQLWKREMRNEFDAELYKKNLGVASALLSRIPRRTSYSPR